MSTDRYVVLGLAHVRSGWSTEVARWATTGSLPVEFVKCVGPDELRARVASGRLFSAALLDGRLATVDRDLIATLAEAEIASIVVDGGNHRDWRSLGAVAKLAVDFDRGALIDALADHARVVEQVPSVSGVAEAADDPISIWRSRLVAVVGRPGAGTSTTAAALAQRVSEDPRQSGDVVLADLARRAHQALLHDARDVVPGVQELIEAHRSGNPSFEQVKGLCFDVPVRRYRLLLGMRRPLDWVGLRPRAFAAALDGLRSSTRLVVADVDDDLEGEAETGSYDIEDRNVMARTTLRAADVVVAVGVPTVTGVHGLVTLVDDLRRFDVPGDRILTVFNRAPRNVRSRAELSRVLAELTGANDVPDPHVGPVFLPERRSVESVHRDLGRIPAALADPVGTAVLEMLDRLDARAPTVDATSEPVAIRPGELGHWDDEEPDAEAGL